MTRNEFIVKYSSKFKRNALIVDFQDDLESVIFSSELMVNRDLTNYEHRAFLTAWKEIAEEKQLRREALKLKR